MCSVSCITMTVALWLLWTVHLRFWTNLQLKCSVFWRPLNIGAMQTLLLWEHFIIVVKASNGTVLQLGVGEQESLHASCCLFSKDSQAECPGVSSLAIQPVLSHPCIVGRGGSDILWDAKGPLEYAGISGSIWAIFQVFLWLYMCIYSLFGPL